MIFEQVVEATDRLPQSRFLPHLRDASPAPRLPAAVTGHDRPSWRVRRACGSLAPRYPPRGWRPMDHVPSPPFGRPSGSSGPAARTRPDRAHAAVEALETDRGAGRV